MVDKKNSIDKLIDDSIDLGFGLFSYSKEKLDKIVDGMVDRGEISRNEAEDKASELKEKGKKQEEDLKKFVGEYIEEYLDLDDYVKKSEVEDLVRKEVERLKREEEGEEEAE